MKTRVSEAVRVFVTRIARRMPESIRSVLRPVYGTILEPGLRVVWDKRLLREVEEYFQLNERQAKSMCKLLGTPNAMLWAALDPKTEDEIRRFYEITPFYVCELACWHMERQQRRLRESVIKVASGDVLDYGGGIGDLCVRLAEKGLNVTYADIHGRTFEFAEWLFRRRDVRIEMIDLRKEKLPRKYDTIICLDVIEHVPQPEAVLENIVGHLREHGKLIVTIPPIQKERHPMHLERQFDEGQLFRSMGLSRGGNDWLWVKASPDKQSWP
jgi:SAM-dependent methyltransferase